MQIYTDTFTGTEIKTLWKPNFKTRPFFYRSGSYSLSKMLPLCRQLTKRCREAREGSESAYDMSKHLCCTGWSSSRELAFNLDIRRKKI